MTRSFVSRFLSREWTKLNVDHVLSEIAEEAIMDAKGRANFPSSGYLFFPVIFQYCADFMRKMTESSGRHEISSVYKINWSTILSANPGSTFCATFVASSMMLTLSSAKKKPFLAFNGVRRYDKPMAGVVMKSRRFFTNV